MVAAARFSSRRGEWTSAARAAKLRAPMTEPDRPPSLQERLLKNPLVRLLLWPALFFGVGGLEPIKKRQPRPPRPPTQD
jgi:hypothetical protein